VEACHSRERQSVQEHLQVTVISEVTVTSDAAQSKADKKITLTNLYNARLTWLDLAHKKLDQAVFAAYGWRP
jgi:hypothetical protein